jgi:hypothetical protein
MNNNGNESISPLVYRQTGDQESRIAQPGDLQDMKNQHLLIPTTGLTKREYFAAMAMQGIIARPDRSNFYVTNGDYLDYASIAKDAVGCADALLTALSSPNLLNK